MANLLSKIKYPKLLLLTLAIIFAYVLFRADFFTVMAARLNHHGYISMFMGGMLFSFGFTAPFAVALFIELSPIINPLLGAAIGGIGALISDIAIFRFIKISFRDEFELLKLHWLVQKMKQLFDNHFSENIKRYALWTFAGILIASPLPDEFGITLLGGITDINQKTFALISLLLNTAGIFAILWFSNAL